MLTRSHILVSSYLSHVRILPLNGQPLYTLPLPTSLGATCCSWISPSSQTNDILVAAGGVDRSVHVFTIPTLDPSSSTQPRELYTLMGHTGPISAIVASPSGSELVSASWDGNLHLYNIPATENADHQLPAEPTSYLPGQKKRRKVGEVRGPIEGLTDGDVGEGGWRRAPEGIMRGHKGRVGALVWDKEQSGRVWSGGWDGSVRAWEVESGVCDVVRQGPTDKSILTMDQFWGTGTLITGSMDRTVSLWDTKQGELRLREKGVQLCADVQRPRSLRKQYRLLLQSLRCALIRLRRIPLRALRILARSRSGTCGHRSTPCLPFQRPSRVTDSLARTARCLGRDFWLWTGMGKCWSPVGRTARWACGVPGESS